MLKWAAFPVGVFLFLLVACSHTTGNETENSVEWPSATEVNSSIGRGVNLGNALDAPSEGAWGVVLQASYFKEIASAGFNSVRLPVRWSAHALVDSPYTIDASFISRVDWAIQQAFNNNLLVVMDIHHYQELFSNPGEHKKRFLAIWEQLARHYKNYSWQLIFEILNEPHDQLTPQLWNVYLREALQIIRQTNPQRAVVIGTANWGGVDALNYLSVPDDDYLILTVHYYKPFHFTHQGASWVEGSSAWLGTTWLGTNEEKQAITGDFDVVQKWASARNLPVFVGEFGAYSKADLASRVRWTSFVAREAEKHGFSWAYWEFASGFGVYDPDANQWRSELLNALIPQQ